MKSFFEKDDYTIEDIKSLITNEVEESIHLDFKEAAAFEKSDQKKRDISKDVSAFANSDGGVIVYGISEMDHKAHSLSFIDGNIFTKEWLEQVIASTIQKHIADLRIFPIRVDGQITQSIYVVKIPKSLDAPHLARDKRFYKRFNFESVPMEEYEIRQLYGRKLISELELEGWGIRQVRSDDGQYLRFLFEAHVVNVGDVMEEKYKVNVQLINFTEHVNFSWDPRQTNHDYTIIEEGRFKISAVGNTPIFPNEKITVVRFSFEISQHHIVEALNSGSLKIVLLYSNGENEMTGDLKELINNLRPNSTL